MGAPASFWARLPPLDELHREVRPAGVGAHVVDPHDALVAQTRDRLRFPLEPRPLVRSGVAASEEHLHRDGTVKAQVPGLINDTHAAAAECGLYLIARNLGQFGGRIHRSQGIGELVRLGRRKHRVEFGIHDANLLPALADLR
jgi:hypothetical protein